MLSSRELTRRHAIAVAAAVVVLALVAGAAVGLGLVGGEATLLDQVPDDAETVVRIDPAVLDDPTSRSLLASGLAATGFGSPDVDDALGEFEGRTGLSLAAIDDAVAFGRYGPAGRMDVRYVGAIVQADWEGERVRNALSQSLGIEYENRTYEGHTVYQPAGGVATAAPTVGVLAEGEFVVGTPLAVEDAIAVANGNAGALGGPVRNALSRTDDGLVTAAATLPRERVENFDARTGGLTRLGSVHVVAGAYDTDGESISVAVRLRTNGTEAARDVTDVTRGGLAILANDVGNETTAETLRAVDVQRQGKAVTLRLETTASDLRRLARYYGFGGV